MALIRSKALLWPGPIPYLLPVPAVVQRAVAAFKAELGFDLWVGRENIDKAATTAWVEFNVQKGSSSCSEIGCQKKGVQYVHLGNDWVFTTMHEMLHCAGFEHEQFHPKYAWDRGDVPDMKAIQETENARNFGGAVNPKLMGAAKELPLTTKKPVATSNQKPTSFSEFDTGKRGAQSPGASPKFLEELKVMRETGKPIVAPSLKKTPTSPAYKALKSERNRLLYRTIAELETETYVDGFLSDLKSKEHAEVATASCDYDSIMMYRQFIRAAEKVQEEIPNSGVNTDGAGKDDESIRTRLSAGDKVALRTLYGPHCK